MDLGVIVPQGWLGEYDGWDSRRAWRRTKEVAAHAERIGFESIWVFDHFQTHPVSKAEITFESFTTLTALAETTTRVRLGHVVACAGYRNPALLAKMVSTLDTVSNGRMELGLGAGWKEDEYRAYGYPYPDLPERLALLRDTLEVVTRMLSRDGDGRATFDGRYAKVLHAYNIPKPLQTPRVPVMVGGNGPKVTWRLAARFADELNMDGLEPDQVAAALPVIRQRCEEIDRDPASLRLSLNVFWKRLAERGSERIDLLSSYRQLGLHRIHTLIRRAAETDEALESYAEDALAAGAHLQPPVPAPTA